MKKIVCILMIVEVLLCLSACGAEKEDVANTGTSLETSSEITVEANSEKSSEVKEDKNFEINPAFFTTDALMKMFEEKDFPDYDIIYEEAAWLRC